MSELQNIIGAYSLCELEEKLKEATNSRDQVEDAFSKEYSAILDEQNKRIEELSKKWRPARRAALKGLTDYRNAIAIAEKYGLGDETTDYIKKQEDAGLILREVEASGTEIWTRK